MPHVFSMGIEMQQPVGEPVDIWSLIPGEKYYAFAVKNWLDVNVSPSYFRGVFTEYYVNIGNYNMLKFNYALSSYNNGFTTYVDSPEVDPHGVYWRIWENGRQSYQYYRVSRFTEKEKKELKERCVLRDRRQYERGLTGSTETGLWFPRDLAREISLKYLTDENVCPVSKRIIASSNRLSRECHPHSPCKACV